LKNRKKATVFLALYNTFLNFFTSFIQGNEIWPTLKTVGHGFCMCLLSGTPITRLPIMAKGVLDLFQLYKLVIERGGLVEVINKKLWQEICKELRIPSSCTSAAFSLRRQSVHPSFYINRLNT
jgi:hypothetical protein